MAGVRDRELKGTGPWPQGINNLAKEGRLPTDENGRVVALREADNIDLDRDGFAARRGGTERFYTGTLSHSLWSHDDLPFGLFVDDGELQAVEPDGSVTALGVAMGSLPVSYELFGDRVLFCNRLASGMVGVNLQPHAWAAEQPAGQPHAAPVAGLSLNPGQYQVAVTFTDVRGRESGQALAAAVVDVGEGQGIELTQIPVPQSADTVRVNVYLTDANDQELRLHSSLSAGTTTTLIGAQAQGRALMTQFLQPMPSGQFVALHNGRQFVADGKYLRWSPAMRYGLTNPAEQAIRFNATIDLMAAVGRGTEGAGLYVAAGKRTYWHGGKDPANWNQAIAFGHGAVPGSLLEVTGDVLGFDTAAPVAFWLARNGQFVVGLPGGQVMPLKRGTFVANDADRAAVLLREHDGVSQIITALRGPRHNGFAVSDRVVAHIIHDETTP
jgi:hypothetical protein